MIGPTYSFLRYRKSAVLESIRIVAFLIAAGAACTQSSSFPNKLFLICGADFVPRRTSARRPANDVKPAAGGLKSAAG